MMNNKKLAFHQRYSLLKVLIGYLIIILFTLIVALCSIWIFTFTLAPKIKGLSSIFAFLIIPLAYLGAYLYASKKIKKIYNFLDEKQRYKIDISLQTFVYIIILLFLFFIFLLSLYFPLQKQGINNERLSFKIQPYLFENQSEFYYLNDFSKAHDIYSKYNIYFNILEPIMFNKSIEKNLTEMIFKQNCTVIGELYNLTDYEDKETIKVIFLDFNGSINGMGSICGKGDLAIISINNSMPGWVLAHELGHILGAKKECWRYNLMKEYSRECSGANWVTHDFIRDLQPDFLNQKQVDVITESIKNRFS